MKNIFTLTLLVCFIVCTHLKRDFNISITKNISATLITALQTLNTKTYTNSIKINSSISNVQHTAI